MDTNNKSISKEINPNADYHQLNPVYARILEGWFSEFNNGMTPILMRVGSKRISRLQGGMRWKAIYFLTKLRGHYKFLGDCAIPAIEFLISFFERYPNVTEDDFCKGSEAVDQIYEGLGILRPSKTAAIVAEIEAPKQDQHEKQQHDVLDEAASSLEVPLQEVHRRYRRHRGRPARRGYGICEIRESIDEREQPQRE